MRLHRFYVEQPLGEEVVIDNVPLIQQWTKVFRYTNGDSVILFNGSGLDIMYILESIANKQCILRKSTSTASFVPTKKITLYLSLIKKDNFELVIQKATELGISTIVPIVSERSEKKNLNFERLHKIAVEASEQCFRGDVPKILPITTLKEAINSLSNTSLNMVLQMNQDPVHTILQETATMDEICLFVGPEGGWGEEDERLFEVKHMKQFSLGKTVLRAETAAIATCTLVTCL